MKTFVFALLGLMSAPVFALDNARLAQNLRETLGLDSRTPVEVQGQPVPAAFGDLNKVSVLVGGSPYDVFISKDETAYLWGFTADLTKSPDRERVASIDPKTGHMKGSPKAKVTIVEYSDFACQFCRKAHDMLKTEISKAYKPDQVKLVFKHYPLTSHAWALPAASAADCAEKLKPGSFWKMADFFFGNQSDFTEQNVAAKSKEYAVSLGVDASKYDACLADPKTQENVLAQKKEGAAIGVTSTPTLFVNGRMRRGFRDFSDVKVLIDEKLAEKGK
jgi:protein-disulfide isomerase